MNKKEGAIAAGGIVAIGLASIFVMPKVFAAKSREVSVEEIGMDPDITRDGNIFSSLGDRGHRIWLPNASGTIILAITNLSEGQNVVIEQNCSRGYAWRIPPNGGAELKSMPTQFRAGKNGACRLDRTIEPSETPGNPWGRVNGADLNIWFIGGRVRIDSLTVVG